MLEYRGRSAGARSRAASSVDARLPLSSPECHSTVPSSWKTCSWVLPLVGPSVHVNRIVRPRTRFFAAMRRSFLHAHLGRQIRACASSRTAPLGREALTSLADGACRPGLGTGPARCAYNGRDSVAPRLAPDD